PAEVYDPASGTWSLTGVLNNFRSGHAAVLLLTGRVLAAGGEGTAGTLGSSELYDPLNGQWHLTAPMDQPGGGGATGVRLASGSVLVVGIGSGVQRVSSEVYDPVTATWAPSAVIPSAVIGFIPAPGLVALHDGAPLLALSVCAHIGCFPITTALFDPNAGLWTPTTGPMLSFRSGMTVLSDGRVLLVGNASSFTNPTPPSPAVLFRHDDSTPRLVVSPLTVDIGKTRPGIAVQRTVSLQNTGGAALVGNATTAVPFNILSGSPFTLAPGASATAVVQFTPSDLGTFSGVVQFMSNGNWLSVSVTGEAGIALSGRITDGQGIPLRGVEVELHGASTSATTTDAAGQYAFIVQPSNGYTVTPTDPRATFSPTTRSVLAGTANLGGLDFVAQAVTGVSLAAAVLPGSRSVQVGSPATAFATVINLSLAAASACGITPVTNVPATFAYQTTDPLTNAV